MLLVRIYAPSPIARFKKPSEYKPTPAITRNLTLDHVVASSDMLGDACGEVFGGAGKRAVSPCSSFGACWTCSRCHGSCYTRSKCLTRAGSYDECRKEELVLPCRIPFYSAVVRSILQGQLLLSHSSWSTLSNRRRTCWKHGTHVFGGMRSSGMGELETAEGRASSDAGWIGL